MDYIEEATQTLSPEFHAEKVEYYAFMNQLAVAMFVLEKLDHFKKALFYGRDLTEEDYSGPENIQNFKGSLERIHPNSEKAQMLVHGIIGVATEAGELLELLYDTLAMNRGAPLDITNLIEESGDCKWYLAILAKAGGYSWNEDEQVNINKLRARFPEKFTEYDANNRNLEVERSILENRDRP